MVSKELVLVWTCLMPWLRTSQGLCEPQPSSNVPLQSRDTPQPGTASHCQPAHCCLAT